MKCRFLLAVAAMSLLTCGIAGAQMIDAEPTRDFGLRLSAGVDWKVARNLHLSLEEEARFDNNIGSFNRLNSTLGIDWKINRYLKAGAGYSFVYKPEDLRHKIGASITGHYRFGAFNFSLRETVQMTHFCKDINSYQKARNALALKSRIKVSYKARTIPLNPYLSCELRNTLNAPRYTSTAASSMTYADAYINRVRTRLGAEWRLNKANSIDFFGQFDYLYDKKIDAKKDGTLKTITNSPAYNFCLGLAYRFAIR